MARVLVLFSHPRTDRSEVNAALFSAARAVEGIEFADLYSEYPDFDIDIDREQERLRAHDVIVFQHPVYWYSCPALLKEWIDLVLEHGFAYGTEGNELKGKTLLQAVTCGAGDDAYRTDGSFEHELRPLFAPFEQTAKLCGMRYLAPFAVFAARHAAEEKRLEEHVSEYANLLKALRDDCLDLSGAADLPLLTGHLQGLVTESAEVL